MGHAKSANPRGLVNANAPSDDHKEAGTGRRRTPPGVGTILDSIAEEPVTYGEMERLRFVRKRIWY
jgi:hypothetical protein